jgi:hypothetical protein
VTEAVWEALMQDDVTGKITLVRFVAWNVTDAVVRAEERLPDHTVVGVARQ